MQYLPELPAPRRRDARHTLGLLAAAPFAAQAQTTPTANMGIGTTAPTQTLDVNGHLRVRGLSGTDTRLPAHSA